MIMLGLVMKSSLLMVALDLSAKFNVIISIRGYFNLISFIWEEISFMAPQFIRDELMEHINGRSMEADDEKDQSFDTIPFWEWHDSISVRFPKNGNW